MDPNRWYARGRANGVSTPTIVSAILLGLLTAAAGQAQANDLRSPWKGRTARTLSISPPRDAHSSYVLCRSVAVELEAGSVAPASSPLTPYAPPVAAVSAARRS